jgi:hypothetical protein
MKHILKKIQTSTIISRYYPVIVTKQQVTLVVMEVHAVAFAIPEH